ncbi:MAG: YdeI/OmpD-associated family protein, partial [Sediminibacterium sp.]|nr:YdeI/OmpD-associated family protein [Sediminibacterium sp.]
MSGNQNILEKLQLKEEKNLLIQGLPSSVEKQFAKLAYNKNLTPLLKTRKIDFALIFAINQLQLNNILKEVFPALHPESKLWIAYPKTTSKIVSDLNRDASWEILSKNEYEAVRQVTLDHVWTAMRFKKLDQIPNRNRTFVEFKAADIKVDDFEKRLIALPIELDKLFGAHEEAREFFVSLSILNQKEYLSWIQGAKKE